MTSSTELPQEPKKSFDPRYVGLGIGIGCGLGVALHNLPIGVGLGFALGLMLGGIRGKQIKRKSGFAAENDPPAEQ